MLTVPWVMLHSKSRDCRFRYSYLLVKLLASCPDLLPYHGPMLLYKNLTG